MNPERGYSQETPHFFNQLVIFLGAFTTFSHYFESYKFVLESKYTQNCENWPDVWDFGKVVRNAFSYGGRINFRNPNASPVKWLSLRYSPINNGLRIIEDDISCAEMILLLEEMDIHL